MKSQNAINASKHGMCYSYTYRSWQNARDRCNNPNNPAYKKYGGRGITVCDKWNNFENFVKDMGERPNGMSLDRINNDKGYSKENCRWANAVLQSNNRRNIKKYKGKSMAEWSRLTGIKPSTIRQRVYVYGWPMERAIQ